MLDFGESTELTTRIEVNWRRHTNQKPTRLVWYSIWYNPPKSYPHPFDERLRENGTGCVHCTPSWDRGARVCFEFDDLAERHTDVAQQSAQYSCRKRVGKVLGASLQ